MASKNDYFCYIMKNNLHDVAIEWRKNYRRRNQIYACSLACDLDILQACILHLHGKPEELLIKYLYL